MEEKKFSDEIFKNNTAIYINESLKNRTCYCRNCSAQPISSHTFQKSAILNKLSLNGEIFSTTHQTKNRSKKENSIQNFLFRTSTKTASTFKGFCSDHDNSIFLPIEKKNTDIDIIEYIFLNAYRGFAYAHNLEKPIYNNDYNVDNTPYFKKAIKKNKKMVETDRGNYVKLHNSSKEKLASTYDISKYDHIQNIFESIIFSNGEIDKTKRIMDQFSLAYVEIPHKINWAASAGANYDELLVKNEKTRSHPVSIGLIPENHSFPAIFYFLCLKKESKLHYPTFNLLNEYAHDEHMLKDTESEVYLFIQNIILLLSANIIISPLLYKKLKNSDELAEVNKFYCQTTFSRFLPPNKARFILNMNHGFNLFN